MRFPEQSSVVEERPAILEQEEAQPRVETLAKGALFTRGRCFDDSWMYAHGSRQSKERKLETHDRNLNVELLC